MKPFILGCTFARGGSKGIPRKNIRSLNGKPLIAYAIELGLSIKLIDQFIVSTDDQEIADVACQYGAGVPFMRPADLAADHSPEMLSWKHALETFEQQTGEKVDILVSIPATSPLRIREDVERCIQKLLDSDADIVITATSAHRSPYFNMVTLDAQDSARIVISSDVTVNRRQEAPVVYDVTTVAYAARAEFVLKAKSVFEGRVKAVVIPQERALDIDTPLDFEIAEFLMKRGNTK